MRLRYLGICFAVMVWATWSFAQSAPPISQIQPAPTDVNQPMSEPLSAVPVAENPCTDPAAAPFNACLTSLALYTEWMIVPGKGRGKLQEALLGLSNDVQSDWTGPRRSRTYLWRAYLFWPVAVGSFCVLLFIVRMIFRPQLSSSGPP